MIQKTLVSDLSEITGHFIDFSVPDDFRISVSSHASELLQYFIDTCYTESYNCLDDFLHRYCYSSSCDEVCVPSVRSFVNILLLLCSIEYFTGKYPTVVNSLYRSASVNTRVGGVPRSYHLLGLAVDLSKNDFSEADINRLPVKFFKVIKYSTFYHIQLNKNLFTFSYE